MNNFVKKRENIKHKTNKIYEAYKTHKTYKHIKHMTHVFVHHSSLLAVLSIQFVQLRRPLNYVASSGISVWHECISAAAANCAELTCFLLGVFLGKPCKWGKLIKMFCKYKIDIDFRAYF